MDEIAAMVRISMIRMRKPSMTTRFEMSKPGMRLSWAAIDESGKAAMVPWDLHQLIAPATAASGGWRRTMADLARDLVFCAAADVSRCS
jgi:hypothetical protein